jgi:hypothetical protein
LKPSKVNLENQIGHVANLNADRIRIAYAEARDYAEHAVERAIFCGQLLNEAKAASGHGNFMDWLTRNIPEIPHRTATRWMAAAESVMLAVKLPSLITDTPMSVILSSPVDELDDDAQAARQLVFDFLQGKTLRDCIEGVIVGGDDPSAITRSHNGRSLGGAGGDRKDFPVFVARAFDKIASHLDRDLPASQQVKIQAAVQAAVQTWPRWILEVAKEAVVSELRKQAGERASSSPAARDQLHQLSVGK